MMPEDVHMNYLLENESEDLYVRPVLAEDTPISDVTHMLGC